MRRLCVYRPSTGTLHPAAGRPSHDRSRSRSPPPVCVCLCWSVSVILSLCLLVYASVCVSVCWSVSHTLSACWSSVCSALHCFNALFAAVCKACWLMLLSNFCDWYRFCRARHLMVNSSVGYACLYQLIVSVARVRACTHWGLHSQCFSSPLA